MNTATRRFILTTLLAASIAPAVADDPPLRTERNRQLIDTAFARWAAGGSGFFEQVLHEDVVWTIKGSGPSAGVHRSRAAFIERAVKPFAARMAVPVKPVSRQVWAQGEHVIVQWDGEGVAADRAPYRNSYVWILRMRGERAAEVTAYLDLAPYDDVLRRIPSPPQ